MEDLTSYILSLDVESTHKLFIYVTNLNNTKNLLKTIATRLLNLTYLKIEGLSVIDDDNFFWIGKLRNLVCLELNNQKIRQIPESIVNLEQLEELHLHNNKIEEIPEYIALLKSLLLLDLSNNRINGVNKKIGQLKNLVWLNLSNNKLTAFPKDLLQLSNLERLDLSGNIIKVNEDIQIRVNTLMPKLRTLITDKHEQSD